MADITDILNSVNYKTWRFSLISSLGTSLLEINPIGWDEVGLTLARTEPYNSVFRTYSADIEYVRNGYDIITELEETEGILAECELLVENRSHISQEDTEVFSAKLDFTDYKESSENRKGVSLPLVDDTFHEKLKSRETNEVPYDREVDMDGNEITAGTYETVSIEGRPFGGKTNGSVWEEVESGDLYNFYNFTSGGFINYVLNTSFEDIDILPYFSDVTKRGYNGTIASNITSTDCFYYQEIGNSFMNLTYRIYGYGYNASVSFVIYKCLFDESGSVLSYEDIAFTDFLNANIDETLEVSTTLTENEGLVLVVDSELDLGSFTAYQGMGVRVVYKSIYEATDCQLVLPHEAFSQCAYAITGEADSFRSNYFGRTDLGYDEDGEGAYLATTKGLLLRQFPAGYVEEVDEDEELSDRVAQLSYKFRELFESYHKVKNLSLRVVIEDGKHIIEVEKKGDFYSDEVALTIESEDLEDKSFQRVRDISMYYSGVDVGYVTYPEDLFGGLEEYSNREEYTSILSNVDNVLDLVSAYSGASVPLEKTRRKPFSSTSTEETTHDNTIFFIELVKDEEGNLKQRDEEGFDEINGLKYLSPKINMGITPKQNMRNHGDSLNVGLAPYPTSKLLYDTSDKTTDLSFKYTGSTELIVENGSEIAGSLLNPRFTGFKLVFSAPLSLSQILYLKNNTDKLVGVWNPIKQEYAYGWISEVSTEPTKTTTNWELIEANPPDLGLQKILVTDEEKVILTDEDKAIEV